MYGFIGFMNFGYIDKLKFGILEYLNDKLIGKVYIFFDDIVGGIVVVVLSCLVY